MRGCEYVGNSAIVCVCVRVRVCVRRLVVPEQPGVRPSSPVKPTQQRVPVSQGQTVRERDMM